MGDSTGTPAEPELINPVTESSYRGRAVAITVRNNRVYDLWVDRERFECHVPHPVLNNEPYEMLAADNIAQALRVLHELIDNEDTLRQQFPLGATVTTRSNRKEIYAKGSVVGHRNRQVFVKITSTTYKAGGGHPCSVVGSVQPMLPGQLHAPDPYPEHTKLKNHRDARRAVGEFLEWLLGEATPYFLATWEGEAPFQQPNTALAIDPEDLIAQWLGVDRAKLDAENEAMLAAVVRASYPSADHHPTTDA